MSTQRKDCVWCGTKLENNHESRRHAGFCPECHATFETEAHRSMHPAEERHPHND